nr:MAG TPA: hypothetical protein [Caudoviricetes sp.]
MIEPIQSAGWRLGFHLSNRPSRRWCEVSLRRNK